MNEPFTTVWVQEIPTPWPPSSPTRIISQPVDDSGRNLWVIGHPDGHLEMVARDSGGQVIAQCDLQIIAPEPGNLAVLSAMYDGTSLSLMLMVGSTSYTLKRLSAHAETIIIPGRERVQPIETSDFATSLADVSGPAVCESAIARRAQLFESWPRLRHSTHPRRDKALKDMVTELSEAERRLHSLVRSVSDGEAHLTPMLAAQIRALVYWNPAKPSATYNPLLYRLANTQYVGLPVYTHWHPSPSMPSIADPLWIIQLAVPYVGPRRKGATLMDLMDYMDLEIARFADDQNAERTLSPMECIAGYANTSGGSHYDPSESIDLSVIQSYSGISGSDLDSLVVSVATVIFELCGYVANALDSALDDG